MIGLTPFPLVVAQHLRRQFERRQRDTFERNADISDSALPCTMIT